MLKNQSKKVFNIFTSELIKKINIIHYNQIKQLCDLLLRVKKNKNKVIIFGNGAGQSIANHFSVDITKNCLIKSLTFSEGNHITCYSNDYGFENWVFKTIEKFYKKGDLIILMSASGNSKNMIKAANYCKKNKIKLVTLTGFNKKNNLKKMGNINIWINSNSFNVVEILFSYVLLVIVDIIKGSIFYSNKK